MPFFQIFYVGVFQNKKIKRLQFSSLAAFMLGNQLGHV